MAARDIMKSKNGDSFASIDEFVVKMKSEDANNLRIAKSMFVIYFVGIFIYGFFFVVSIVGGKGFWDGFSWFSILLAFVIFAYIFWLSKNIYRKVDYSLSVVEMLRQAKQRYRFWHPMVWLANARNCRCNRAY